MTSNLYTLCVCVIHHIETISTKNNSVYSTLYNDVLTYGNNVLANITNLEIISIKPHYVYNKQNAYPCLLHL